MALLLLGHPDAGVADHEPQPVSSGQTNGEKDLASVRKLRGVAQQVYKDLANPDGISHKHRRDLLLDKTRKLHALLVEATGYKGQGLLHKLREIVGDVLQLQLARLNLREVKDVVDDPKKRLPGVADGLCVLALLFGKVRREQELGHPDNAVHRRPYLV
nr:hypothetical protein [Rubrobacter indicoceani]